MKEYVLILRKAASRKYSGFTLVELIVVITILAILATIGFLSLSGYSDDARDSAIKANVRSMVAAISSESALTGNSPRYYVVHDSAAALAGAFVYVDGSPVALTGGSWDTGGTNYSAGNPDYVKLKLDAEKFKVASGIPAFPEAFAAYDAAGQLSVGAMDYSTIASSGRKRSSSYFQVAAVNPATKAVIVFGDYPWTTLSGSVAGLVKDSTGTGALVDGEAANGGTSSEEGASRYPGCDMDDIYLTGSNQYWAACNVGASHAWTGALTINNCGGAPDDCDSSIRYTLGSYFQWGRNEDVTALGSGTVLASAGSAASAVLGYFVANNTTPFDWMESPQNDNLWGGGGTQVNVGSFSDLTAWDQLAMRGPCAPGYHVPTQAEWWSAIDVLHPGIIDKTLPITNLSDSTIASVLRLPISGLRIGSSAGYNLQGTNSRYWTSTPAGTQAYRVGFAPTGFSIWISIARSNGASVRCLKN